MFLLVAIFPRYRKHILLGLKQSGNLFNPEFVSASRFPTFLSFFGVLLSLQGYPAQLENNPAVYLIRRCFCLSPSFLVIESISCSV
jgi:hypothetical protein